MTGASTTIRTATKQRLVALAASLEGWQATPDDDQKWWATRPVNGARTNARICVIGTPDGGLEPEAHQAGADPSVDVWTIACGLGLTGVEDGPTAEQEIEDALNQLGDMLAANHRLVDPLAEVPWLGCEQVRIERFEGPFHVAEQGATPLAWIDFDIAVRALIRRSPS